MIGGAAARRYARALVEIADRENRGCSACEGSEMPFRNVKIVDIWIFCDHDTPEGV